MPYWRLNPMSGPFNGDWQNLHPIHAPYHRLMVVHLRYSRLRRKIRWLFHFPLLYSVCPILIVVFYCRNCYWFANVGLHITLTTTVLCRRWFIIMIVTFLSFWLLALTSVPFRESLYSGVLKGAVQSLLFVYDFFSICRFTRVTCFNATASVVVLGKKYLGGGGAAPSSFGRQQRLSEITIEPINNNNNNNNKSDN